MAEEEKTGFANKLRERYLEFVEGLREKGVPLPHLVVPLVVILIISGLALYVVPGISVEKRDVTLTVQDNLGRAVPGAVVEVVSAGQTVSTQTADATGKVNLQSVAINAEVKVTAEGFTPKSRRIDELLQRGVISLQSTSPPTKDVNVRVLDATGQGVANAFVQLSFASGDFAPQVTTDAGGNAVITVQESQLAAGTISINAPGVESTQQAVSQEQLESGTVLITVSSQLSTTTDGSFVVTVSSASGPVQDARVTLVNVVTDSEEATELTTQDGTVRFENVALGSTFTVRVTHSQFNQLSQEFTPTADNNALALQLTARSAPASSLTITVLNENLQPLSAIVNIFDDNGNLLESGETDTSGEFTLSISSNVNAYATAYTDGYLPGFLPDLAGGSARSIRLSQALPGNSVQLSVTVNQDGFPASNAEVSLYRSGGFFLGIPPIRVAGQGIGNATIPSTIDGQAYKVFARASKEAMFGQSDAVDVGGANPVSLSIDLLSLPANVTVNLQDLSTSQAIPTGNVEAVIEGLPVASCTAQSGSCVLTVSAGKQFAIHVTSQGYLQYTTAPLTYSAGEKANTTIKLFPLSLAQGATTTFIGLFDSSNAKVREVVNAETYTAKFAVSLPQNVQQAGFYLQTGEEQTVDESVASISSFDSNGAPFVQSDSSLPANGTCYSGQNNPNTDKKWVYFSFSRGFVGTKEFAVKIKVAKTATADNQVNLIYKAFGFKDNLLLPSPSDAELLDSLRQKADAGEQLTPEDTCAMKTFTQSIPVSHQTLVCNEQDFCWKATLYDATARGSPTTFQPQVTRDFSLDLELIAPRSIDSLAIATDHFNLKNSQQVLAPVEKLSFQSAPANNAGSSGTLRVFNVPFTSLANRKAKVTMTLTPLKVSQSAAFNILLRSGDETFTIPIALSIGGTNIFTVTAAPPQVAALSDSKVTIIVRDRSSRPVEDASVALFECEGSPFSGNEPEQLLGDATINNGQNGVYRISVNPTGLGEIGVRVESPDFRAFESCLVTVTPKDFLSIDPSVLEFTGSSIEPQAQQVTLTNPLNEPATITTSVNCGGDQVPVKIFPLSTTIDANSDSVISIKLLQNITSTAQCIAYFNARIGTFKSTEELPISVNVNCPDCQLAVSSGTPSAPLPATVTLYATPPFFQDSVTIPLRLATDPTCTLDGFRIMPGGQYLPGLGVPTYGAPGSTYPQGVLAGIPTPAIWWCDACQPDANGQSQCGGCQQVRPSAWQCGACSPNQTTAYTSSSLPIWSKASCSLCASSYSTYQSRAFTSPLVHQGYPVPVNPAVQRVGFEPTVGAVYREDFGYSGNLYPQRFGVQPMGLPGSPLYPGFNGANPHYPGGLYPGSIKEALRVDQCTRDAITVSADFSYLGQAFPGQGNLFVTLPDGSRKTVRVSVFGSQLQGVGPVASLQQSCALTGLNQEAKVGPDYRFSSNVSIALTCPTIFDLKRVDSIKTKDGTSLDSGSCTLHLNNNELKVYCDFTRDSKAKAALDKDKEVYVKIVLLSTSKPDASANVDIKAVFEGAKETAVPITGATGGTGTSGGGTTPTGTVDIKVFKASAPTKSLCGKRVEAEADLVIKYSFTSGDEASARKVVVKRDESGWKDADAFNNLPSSGSQNYKIAKTAPVGTNQDYSFEASTTYSGTLQGDTCKLTVVDNVPLIELITPVHSFAGGNFGEFTSLFPTRFQEIGTDFDLNDVALKARVYSRDVKASVEYFCNDGNKKILKQDYTLRAASSYGTASIATTNSLDYTKCKPVVDSDIPYKIRVTLYDGTNVVESKYYGEGNLPVDEGVAKFIYINNYPEAAKNLPDPLQLSAFDVCGRLNSPVTSAIGLIKVDSSGNFLALKSTDTLTLTDTLAFGACAKDVNHIGKTFEFLVEYKPIGGSTKTVSLGRCAVPISATPVGNSCGLPFSPSMFADAEPGSLVSFKARIVDGASVVTGSERYLCKYWPQGASDNCASNKVQFKFASGAGYYQNKCVVNPFNPNIIICDVEENDEILLPTNMRFKATDIDTTSSGVELDFDGFHGSSGDDNQLDCYAGPGNTGSVASGDKAEPQDWQSCFEGGPGSLLGEATSLFTAHYVKTLGQDEIPFGRTEKTGSRKIVRVKIFSQFSANENWLKNYYHYNFDVYEKAGSGTGRLIRKAEYVETPKKPLHTLGVQAEPRQGVYILGLNDVVKINAGEEGQTAIVRFVGPDKDGSNLVFEVRRRDTPVIQDCNTAAAGGIIGAASGAVLCFIPAVNIAACPLILGVAGAGVGAAVQSIIADEFNLGVEVGETETCDSAGTTPDVAVRVLNRQDATYNGVSLPEVCVIVASENADIEDITVNVADVCKK